MCRSYQKQGTTLPGDMLLVTAFISYVGGFTRSYRVDLQQKKWLPFLKTLNVRCARDKHEIQLHVIGTLID